MCLIVSTNETLKLIKRNVKTLTVYKRVDVNFDNKTLHPPYIGEAPPYKVGWNVSDSTMKKVCTHDSHMIFHGIHVYLTKDKAERCKCDNEVVKMKVNLEDLLGVSHNETAVFKKAYISPKEYLRGLGNCQ